MLATAALHVASFGESRFHLPLVPLLAVLASLGGVARGVSVGRRVWRRRCAPGRAVVVGLIVVALAVVWVRQWPELRASAERLRAPGGWSSQPPLLIVSGSVTVTSR